MKIAFGTISITKESKKLINKILDSGRLSNGRYVREFEKRFADLVGIKEAVATSSGSDALALALAVLYDFGARRQDEIILPALSFVATGNAVLQAGFTPIFVDIDKKTLNIDPSRIERVITKKSRAIIAVHLMGKPADMKTINRIARKHKLLVIEDAAESYGATYHGKNVGRLADMAAFSLYVAHLVTTIEGGIVVTDKPEFADILRSLRSHGRACNCKECVLNISSAYCEKRFKYDRNIDMRFAFERIGFSSKMNELEAAVGLGYLDIYKDILEKRRRNLEYLKDKFRRFHPYLSTITENNNEVIGPHAFPIIIEDEASFTREELTGYLEKNDIETRTLFSSMPTQCPGFKFLGYRMGDFPNAEYIGDHGLHIGIHQELEKEHLDYFVDCLEKFLIKKIR